MNEESKFRILSMWLHNVKALQLTSNSVFNLYLKKVKEKGGQNNYFFPHKTLHLKNSQKQNIAYEKH